MFEREHLRRDQQAPLARALDPEQEEAQLDDLAERRKRAGSTHAERPGFPLRSPAGQPPVGGRRQRVVLTLVPVVVAQLARLEVQRGELRQHVAREEHACTGELPRAERADRGLEERLGHEVVELALEVAAVADDHVETKPIRRRTGLPRDLPREAELARLGVRVLGLLLAVVAARLEHDAGVAVAREQEEAVQLHDRTAVVPGHPEPKPLHGGAALEPARQLDQEPAGEREIARPLLGAQADLREDEREAL